MKWDNTLMETTRIEAGYGALLGQLQAADGEQRRATVDELVAVASERLRYMAHRTLRGYPTVRRFLETDDVAQGVALRLHRALRSVNPAGPAEFLGLIALQIRRELIDLARRYAGPESPARHLDTDVVHDAQGRPKHRTADAPDSLGGDAESLDRWTRFHAIAATLPDDERAVFDMVWYLGASQAEVAEALGCSVRTVRRRWDAARRHMQTRFRGETP